MSTTVKILANRTAVIYKYEASTHIDVSSEMLIVGKDVLFGFEPFPSAYRFNRILSDRFYARVYTTSQQTQEVAYVGTPTSAVDYDTVTWDTRPEYEVYNRYGSFCALEANNTWTHQHAVPYGSTADTLQNGVYLEYDASYWIKTSLAAASERPYIELELSDDINRLEPTGTPSSGYVNPHADATLKWSNNRKYSSYEKPQQVSAVVTWKETGGAEATISVTTDQQVVIPAETWSSGTSYQWKVTVTDSAGSTTSTDWYTLSTTASQALPPRPLTPDGAVYSSEDAIEFHWVIEWPSRYTGTDLQFSHDGTTWGDPVFVAQGSNRHTMTASSFASGTNYWRARSYNEDSTPGDWSDYKTFIVIGAPQAPYYEVTNSPRPTISWVSDEQQAYQVQMGDYDTGLVFGTAQSFQCPVYLRNGPTTVRVRVMNQYNLWSDWAGTQITIANASSDAPPVLTVSAGAEALLTWTPGYNTTAIDGTDLNWTLGKSISATGSLSGNVPGFGRSDYIALDAATHVRYTGPATGTSDKPYSPMVAFYNGTTFISRELFGNYDGKIVPVPENATQMRVVMGYASAQDETATQTDVEKFTAALFVSEVAHYLVYRDGALIGETDGLSYQDRWGIGDVTYMVRAALTGDNYADSNNVEVTLSVEQPMIAAMDGPWIVLRYTTEPVATTVITTEQTVSLMQFSGAVYPVPEIAPHRTRVYQINTAFPRGEGAVFEELLGRECFLKDQYGNALRGVISSIQKAQTRFYTVYTAALQQIEGDLA